MSTFEMRKSITRMLDNVEDERFLRSVLSMVMAYSDSPQPLTDSQLAELQKRMEARALDNSPGMPWRDSLKAIREGL